MADDGTDARKLPERSEPEYRYDPLTGQWVIVSSVRSQRPDEFVTTSSPTVTCPFCPGNEHLTPPTIASRRSADGRWRVRVVPNKFPALLANPTVPPREGLYARAPGEGVHEVIIETPHHDAPVHKRPLTDLETLLEVYAERLEALYEPPGLAYAAIFRNSGAAAGASLNHPHSQLVALTRLPPSTAARMTTTREHYETAGQCVLCRILDTETNLRDRVVYEDDSCVAFCPEASRFPFQVLIAPRRHVHHFSRARAPDRAGLAAALRAVTGLIHERLDAPAYNWLLHTAPNPSHPDFGADVERSFHCHFELFPRQTRVAGFEWSTGLFINPVPAESAASLLRGNG